MMFCVQLPVTEKNWPNRYLHTDDSLRAGKAVVNNGFIEKGPVAKIPKSRRYLDFGMYLNHAVAIAINSTYDKKSEALHHNGARHLRRDKYDI